MSSTVSKAESCFLVQPMNLKPSRTTRPALGVRVTTWSKGAFWSLSLPESASLDSKTMMYCL